MHTYSIDTGERKYIFFTLAAMSIAFSSSFYKILEYFQFVLPWWAVAPSVMLLYGLLFVAFDKWLWKYFKKINIVKAPNIDGIWNGSLKSSFNDHSGDIKATLKISQTWTKIKILLSTDQSSSHSENASIMIGAPEGICLNYQYINHPKSNSDEAMKIHRGTVRLIFDEKKKTLEGEYYSGRGRQSFGSLNFVKK